MREVVALLGAAGLARLHGQLLEPVEQFARTNLQRLGDADDCGQRRVGLRTLELPDKRSVHARTVGKVFLREPASLPIQPHPLAEGLYKGLVGWRWSTAGHGVHGGF